MSPTRSASPGGRAAAVGMALLATLLTLQVNAIAGTVGYLTLLLSLFALVSVFAAIRLWREDSWDGWVLAVGQCCLSLLVSALNATIGLPGASTLKGINPTWSGVFVVAAAVLCLLTLDALRRPANVERPRPYAL